MAHPYRKLLWAASLITVAIFLLNFYLVGFGVFGDGLGYYLPLRSLLFDGDLRIGDEYRVLADSASRLGQGLRVTGNEMEYSLYTLGMAIVLAPWFIAGHGLAWGLNQAGWDIALNGLTWPYELVYCLGSVLLSIIGLMFCHRLALRFFSPFAATLAVLGVWFASPLTFYTILEPSMSHGVSQCLISLFVYICLTQGWGRRRAQPWILGILLGLATLVRPQNILFGIVPLGIVVQRSLFPASPSIPGSGVQCENALERPSASSPSQPRQPSQPSLVQRLRRNGTPLIVMGLATGLFALLQAGVYYSMHGSVIDTPYMQSGQTPDGGQSFSWGQPQVLNVLFSGFHGLISWHPLLGLGLLGLLVAGGAMARPRTSLRWILLLAFALQLYLISCWWSWWQGASFGGRMFSSCTPIFVLGLAALWDRLPSRWGRAVAVAVTLGAMAWNVLLVMQYESAMIPAEAAVPLTELYSNQFSALPYFINHVLNR